jgi:isochorismate hydrolase
MKENYFETHTIEQKAGEFLHAVKSLREKRKWVFEPASAALLVLDMQNYFTAEESHAYIPAVKAIIPKIKILQQIFLEQGLPVIQTKHINNPGNAGQMKKWWRELISEENPLSASIADLAGKGIKIIKKSQYDAFYNTNLQSILAEKGVKQVIITGVMTHLCCETTARSAFIRGFDVFFGIDTTATYNSRFHLSTLLNLSHGFAVPLLEKEIRQSLIGKKK